MNDDLDFNKRLLAHIRHEMPINYLKTLKSCDTPEKRRDAGAKHLNDLELVNQFARQVSKMESNRALSILIPILNEACQKHDICLLDVIDDLWRKVTGKHLPPH